MNEKTKNQDDFILDVNKRHVQVPNSMTIKTELTPKEILIYVSIKRYMNKDTHEAFPSQDLICKNASSTKPTVKKCIDKLQELGYLKVIKRGRSHIYRFNSYKTFEPFSYDFLDNQDISASAKAQLLVIQQYMYKNIKGKGKISYNDNQLAKITNCSNHTITKCNQELIDKGYLTIIKTDKKDPISGLKINEKIYNLDELQQNIIWTLQDHEYRLTQQEEEFDNMKRLVNQLLKEVTELQKENKEIKCNPSTNL